MTEADPKDNLTILPTPRSKPKGGSGNVIYAGFIQSLETNSEVAGPNWYGRNGAPGKVSECLTDPHFRKALEFLKAPITAGIWDFEAAEDSDLGREIRDFCFMVFFERLKWRAVLRRCLKYLDNGFSVVEPVEEISSLPRGRFPLHPGGGQGLIFRDWSERPARTIERWHQDETIPDQLRSIEQYIPGSDGEDPGYREIPSDRFLRFTWDQDGANFDGLALARSAYGPFKIKRMLQILSAIRHERGGVGIPKMKEPEKASPEDRAAALDSLESIGSSEVSYVVEPDGFEFGWMELEGKGTGLREDIDMHNRDMAFNVGFGHMHLGAAGGSGSYALSTSQEGQSGLTIEQHSKFLVDCINHGSDGYSPVKRIVEANYGRKAADELCPRIVNRSLQTRDENTRAKAIPELIRSGAMRVDKNLRRTVREGLRIPAEDPATLEIDDPTRRLMRDGPSNPAPPEPVSEETPSDE